MLNDLRADAEYNISAYVDCFLSENLLRKFIKEKKVKLVKSAPQEINDWREREKKRKAQGNISFDIRKDNDDLSYLGMNMLAETAEGGKKSDGAQSLWTDALSYQPVRNAVGHTGLLTDTAKAHLTVTRENIKGRVKALVSGKKPSN